MKNQLMVWPSRGLTKTGAVVMLPVMVVVNTFEDTQSSVRELAAKVRDTGLVWAAPSTLMTPDEYRLSTELEPAVNFPMAALVVLSPVMVALVEFRVVMVELVAVSVVAVMLVAVNWPMAPDTPRMVELAVVPMVVPVTVVMLALP